MTPTKSTKPGNANSSNSKPSRPHSYRAFQSLQRINESIAIKAKTGAGVSSTIRLSKTTLAIYGLDSSKFGRALSSGARMLNAQGLKALRERSKALAVEREKSLNAQQGNA